MEPRFPEAFNDLAPRFFASLPYDPRSFYLDEIVAIDRAAKRVEARLVTTKDLPLTDMQRGDPALHPKHLSGGFLVHVTGMLGLVHAFFVNDLRFDEGWVGFGSRIHRADFKRLARPGAPLELVSVETKLRASPDRQIARYEFRFSQEGKLVYVGDQTATWLKSRSLLDDIDD